MLLLYRYREQELQSKDREISGLEKQLHCVEEELAGLSKVRKTTVHENKRLLDDLSLMTEENQVRSIKCLSIVSFPSIFYSCHLLLLVQYKILLIVIGFVN